MTTVNNECGQHAKLASSAMLILKINGRRESNGSLVCLNPAYSFNDLLQMEGITMRVTTTDPISMHDVENPEQHPFVIDGEGESAIKIYFENEENKQAYMDIAVEHPGEDFTTNLDNPQPMAGDTPKQ